MDFPSLANLPAVNPLHLTSQHFFDFGDVESPDGRSHPVTAMTPASLVSVDPQVPIVTPMGTVTIPGSVATAGSGFLSSILPSWPAHFGARLAVAVLALGVLIVVAFRLSK